MTNPSPQDPQNPIPERRQRPAVGLTFDEMIAIFVAFTTIGAILFWSLGGRKSGVANNFALNGGNDLLSASNTPGTAFGLGNIGLGEAESELDVAEIESDQEGFENPLFASKPIAPVTPKKADLSFTEKNFYRIDKGAKLVPLAGGVAASSVLVDGDNSNIKNNAGNVAVENKTKAKPQASIPEAKDKQKTEPQVSAPEITEVPDDVNPTYWAYPFVKQMSDQALVPDLADDHNFEPDKLITRAGMATLISQAFNKEPETEQIKKFKDVSNKNAIAADIDKAVRIGFMQGYSADEFRPLDNIPRYQVLVTLATGLGLESPGDPDQVLQKLENGTDIPDWAKEQVAAAAAAGLIVNRPEFNKNDLKPNESATRAEVAAMIHQALVKDGKLESLDSEYIFNP